MQVNNSSLPIGGQVGGWLRNEEEARGGIWKEQEKKERIGGPCKKSIDGEHGVMWSRFKVLYNILLDYSATQEEVGPAISLVRC